MVENTTFTTENEVSITLDVDSNDFENENDEEIEVDEFNNINYLQEEVLVTIQHNSTISYSLAPIYYRNLHLEFTSPPPKLG